MCTCTFGDLYLADGKCHCGDMARACNVGPVPAYSHDDMEAAFVSYIQNTEDRLVFELGSYASKQKGDHIDIHQIAALACLLTRSRLSKELRKRNAHVKHWLHGIFIFGYNYFRILENNCQYPKFIFGYNTNNYHTSKILHYNCF